MENFLLPVEKNSSVRLMSTFEMMQFFNVLSALKDNGEGNKTIDQLYDEINLKLGKKGGKNVESKPANTPDDDQGES